MLRIVRMLFVFLFELHFTYTLCVVLILSMLGCTHIFPVAEYVTPDLPKTELATIEIDTTSECLKHINLIEVLIDKKLAVRQEIDINKNISIDDVLVTAGEHNITARVYTVTLPHWRGGIYKRKGKLTFSYEIDLKAGGTYLVFLTQLIEGGLYIEFIDKDTNQTVHKKRKSHFTP